MNIKTQRQIKNIKLGLQGGGSLGAYTAGVLCSILSDPTIKITEITGTSAGAMNGMIVAQTINKYGDNEEGRNTTKQRLVDFWNDVAHPPLPIGTKIMLDWVAAMAPHTTRYLITNSLLDHIKVHLQNPNALASGKIINLTIPAVDENGKERLFKTMR